MSVKSLILAFGLSVALYGVNSSTLLACEAHAEADGTAFPCPPAPAPGFDWTGFYVGGFLGGTLGAAPQGYSVSSTYVATNLPSVIPSVDGVGSQSLGLRGTDIGVEGGYDQRVAASSVVVGLSGDLSWNDISGGRSVDGTLPTVQLPYSITQRLSADWLGSVRLRAGFSPFDKLLVYVTGGPTFGHFSYSASFADTLIPPFSPGNETESASVSGIRAGWTIGSGAEWALSRNWSMAAEYRHSEYSALTDTGVLPLQQPPSTAYINHSSGTIRIDTVRLGVDYHFN